MGDFVSGSRRFEKVVGISTFLQRPPAEFPSYKDYIKTALARDDAIGLVERSLEKMAETGLRSVDFNVNDYHIISDAGLERLRGKAESLDLLPYSTHAICLGPDDLEDDRYRDRNARSVRTGELLGLEVLTFHPARDESWSVEETFAANTEMLRHMCELAGKAGIKVSVENGAGKIPAMRHVSAHCSDLVRLCQEVGAPNIGITLDTGHSNLDSISPADNAREAGQYLLQSHVNDNLGPGGGDKWPNDTGIFGDDLHRMPGLGNIDWVAFTDALDEIGWPGPLMFELGIMPDDSPDEIMENVWPKWLKATGRTEASGNAG